MLAICANICTFLSEHHVCQMSGVGLVLVSDDAHHDGVKIAHNIELLQIPFCHWFDYELLLSVITQLGYNSIVLKMFCRVQKLPK